jgi:protein-S-isoprenylcysteine O-methyltransferase Ste14
MDRKKTVLIAALGGAIAGAIATLLRVDAARITAFAPDQPLLAWKPFLVASVAGWAIFSLYWEHAAKTAAAAKSSESRASRRVHVFLTNIALLLEIAPIRGVGRFLPVSPIVMAAGLAMEAAGLALAIWARRHLGRNWSGEITVKVDHQLIRSGPYRVLRHPIYTGLLVMYLGPMLVTGEWLAVAGFAMALAAYWRKIRIEEATLDGAFGPAYGDYRRETWALVPGLY